MEAGGLVTKLYPTLETPWTVALQAPLSRILEWVAISFSGVPSQPRDQTCISCIQVDSLPLSHQGSPFIAAFVEMLVLLLWDVFLYHDFEVVWQGFVGSTLGPGNTSALPYLWMKCWHVQLNDHWGKSLLLIQAPSCLEADSYCSLSASAYTGNLSDFWPSKKKKSSLCFCFGVCFSLLPPSPLFSLPISGHACPSSGLFQSTFLQYPLSTQKLTTWKLFQAQWFGSSAEFDN